MASYHCDRGRSLLCLPHFTASASVGHLPGPRCRPALRLCSGRAGWALGRRAEGEAGLQLPPLCNQMRPAPGRRGGALGDPQGLVGRGVQRPKPQPGCPLRPSRPDTPWATQGTPGTGHGVGCASRGSLARPGPSAGKLSGRPSCSGAEPGAQSCSARPRDENSPRGQFSEGERKISAGGWR